MPINLAKPGFRPFPLAMLLLSFCCLGGSIQYSQNKTTLYCGLCANEWSSFYEGKNYYDKYNLTQAETFWLRTLKQRRDRLDSSQKDNDRVEMVTAHWLGYMYYEQGRLKEALPLLERVVDLNKNVNGAQHDDTLGARIHLAEVHLAMRDLDKSQKMFEDIHKASLLMHGHEHASIAYVLNGLGLVYVHQKQYQKANKVLNESLQLRNRLYGPNSAAVAVGHLNLGRLYRSEFQFEEANKQLRLALKVSNAAPGKNSDLQSICLDEIGVLESIQGNYSEAEKLERASLELCQRIPNNHFSEVLVMEDIAVTLSESGKLAEARELLKKAIDMRTKMEGKDSIDLANTKNMLSGVYLEEKDYARANELFDESFSQFEKELAKDSPVYMGYVFDKAKLLRQTGKFGASEKLFKEFIAYHKDRVGEKDPYFAAAQYNLGLLYTETGKFKEAGVLLKNAFSIRSNFYGKHSRTALSLDGLGHLSLKAGKRKQAYEYFSQAYAMRKEVLGAAHKDTLESQKDLTELAKASL